MVENENKLVLIVDDDETVLELLEFAIKNAGYRTVTADHGDKVMDTVRSSSPDLIVLDMVLPGKSGIDIVRLLQIEGFSSIPVIIVSGQYGDDFLWKIVQNEPNIKEYMAKPINTELLLRKIKNLLG